MLYEFLFCIFVLLHNCATTMKAIYCIDDDELITSIIKFQLDQILPKQVFHVEIINDPRVVFDTLRQHSEYNINPLVMVVDFQMPHLRGDELIRLVKAKYPEIKVIMLSGNSNAMLVSDLEEEGLLDFYLLKPWDVKDLIDKINSCLPLNLKIN